MFQKIYLGPVTNDKNKVLKDLNVREIVTLAPILVVILWIGLYPKPFFMLITPAVEKMVLLLQPALGLVR